MQGIKQNNTDKTEFTVAFTGHRPEKLNGYKAADNKQLLWELSNVIEDLIVNKNAKVFISGMALGIDQWAARIVLKKIEKYPTVRLVCAIPCFDHQKQWSQESQDEWLDIFKKANSVFYVTKSNYTPACMQIRNQWMVDKADHIIAVWDGTSGGTGNCVKYAKKQNKPITQLDPNKF